MSLVRRSDLQLHRDPRRVVARLFVPGNELPSARQSRSSGVLTRVLALPEAEVMQEAQALRERYAGRHRDLDGLLHEHYEQVVHRLPRDHVDLSRDRRDLIGACFTNEFAVEGAALCNPSAVPHPDQSGVPDGACRFVLSLRAIGEGHLSTVTFRTGVAGPGDRVSLEPVGREVELGQLSPAPQNQPLFAAGLLEAGADAESLELLLDQLPETFTDQQLYDALDELFTQSRTRVGAGRTADLARELARCSYRMGFGDQVSLASRVLWPSCAAESRGIEDARFVLSEDGTYRATYTGYDGATIRPRLMETRDFRAFTTSPLAGPGARDKGMALFPRLIGGRHVAMARTDGESNLVATSGDGRRWDEPVRLEVPQRPWQLLQSGNCGSPVETPAGWLVLTHSVGPVREYALGALLLDLEDPTQVLGALREPLLQPTDDEREGYVPNVLYSCGALTYGGDRLLLPYGAADASVRFAFVDLPALVSRLISDGPG